MHADIALIHPPSIYDFRERHIKSGPISDVIPSTPVFEMYPVGFISMLNHIHNYGYSGRICNVAARMVDSKKFDVEKYIKSIETDLFGIDLHWLPHAQGAISLARLIKRIRPDAEILMGGFSASYFWKEIMQNHPEVNYVLVGDFQEDNLRRLLDELYGSRDFSSIPALAYRENNTIKKNPAKFDENVLKNENLDYSFLMKNAIKYADVKGHMPYNDWINNPEAVTLIEHGCEFNCAFCGGSNFSYKNNFFNTSPLFRDTKQIANEIYSAYEVLGAPVFVVGDINQGGEKFYKTLFKEIKSMGIDVPLLTEYFKPPSLSYLQELANTFPDFTAEISPESSNQTIREKNGRSYSNNELEKSIENAEKLGCKKFDVYFTLGISGQGSKELDDDIEYAKKLMIKQKDKQMKVYTFISPLTPFIDPGSLIYEMPEKYGFKITTKTLAGYFDLLDQGKSWVDFLNYETQWMSKLEIEKNTYRAEIEMMKARMETGLISRDDGNEIIENVKRYANGDEYIPNAKLNSHLSYINKDLEWSNRHKITKTSVLVYWYSKINKVEKEFEKFV
ncbi:TIGR04190 family B12-binding domain/radical SAM domain protein [Cuniculiplasma sp. SKW4]|uniref:TIGR04190 family B12-binding domain/radical SAM domain protein n=1 Tax=Cuniculiplasma sp. SKW4 TaxID=3400171 RepID=UPI003FCF37CB